MNQRVGKAQRWLQTVVSGLIVAVGVGVAPAAIAAERLAIQLGPLQTSVAIADLEHFVQTGQVPADLQPYGWLLGQEVRQALSSNLSSAASNRVMTNLLRSTNGDRLLHLLQRLLVGSTQEDIAAALVEAARQPQGFSLLGVLRAHPATEVTLDLGAAIALVAQMQQPQQWALETALEQTLTVPTLPVWGATDPTAPGEFTIQQQRLTLRDRSRDRTLTTDLYWSEQRQGPLVVLSHGFGADRRFLSYLGQHLASHGFTVAAIEHPASSVNWLVQLGQDRSLSPQERTILPASEFVDRPRDIQFLLNELERLEQRLSRFQDRFSTEQVTVIGHSLGGYTALALAGAELQLDALRSFCTQSAQVGLTPADWLQCTAADLPDQIPALQDSRVAQIVALNPVMGQLFTAESLARVRVPTLILSNTGDTITPPIAQQLLPFHQLQTEKYLLTAIGATHLSAGTPNTLNIALLNNGFVRERHSHEMEPLRQTLKAVSLAFVQQLTSEASRYRPFLSPAYVQSFSTAAVSLRWTTELPQSLINRLEQLQTIDGAIATAPRLGALLVLFAVQLELVQTMGRGLALLVVSGAASATHRQKRERANPIRRSTAAGRNQTQFPKS